VSAPAGDHDAANWTAAFAARLTGSLIHAVLQLKEAPHALGIHIVRYGRSAKANGVLQNVTQRLAQFLELGTGQATGALSRTNSSVEQALIGVDISHPGKKGLVEQRSFDCQLPGVKECGEFLCLNGERFRTRAGESFGPAKVAKLEAAKPARVDEPQLAPAVERQARMRVSIHRSFRSCYQQPSCHSEMDDPLRVDPAFLLEGTRISNAASGRRTQFADNVLADSMNRENRAPLKALRLVRRGGFERLAMTAEPELRDPVATHTRIHAPGDRFYLWQFRHLLILKEGLFVLFRLANAIGLEAHNPPDPLRVLHIDPGVAVTA
jgi:hypothetical protein